LEFFGRTREELLDWALSDAVHPDDLPRVIEGRKRSLESGTIHNSVHRCRRADGMYRWFQLRGIPVRDPEGAITTWYVLLTEIDDHKKAEEALQASERKFRLLVETIPALVWRSTPEGELDYLNRRAVEYLGHTAESLAGGRWLELVHPDHR